MSREKVAMVAVAGVGVVGATIYATRNQTQDNRNRAQQKRDLGLGGAGIGGNRVAGGMERGGSPGPGDRDPGRQVTTAESRDRLPSGPIGGGEGAGGSSARKLQIPFTASNSSRVTGDDKSAENQSETDSNHGGISNAPEKSGWFNSIKNTVGGKSTGNRNDEEGLHDTRGISKMGQETPSKRGPADASD